MRGQNRWEWSTVSGGPEGHVHRSRSWSQGWFRSRRGDPLGSFSFPATWRRLVGGTCSTSARQWAVIRADKSTRRGDWYLGSTVPSPAPFASRCARSSCRGRRAAAFLNVARRMTARVALHSFASPFSLRSKLMSWETGGAPGLTPRAAWDARDCRRSRVSRAFQTRVRRHSRESRRNNGCILSWSRRVEARLPLHLHGGLSGRMYASMN